MLPSRCRVQYGRRRARRLERIQKAVDVGDVLGHVGLDPHDDAPAAGGAERKELLGDLARLDADGRRARGACLPANSDFHQERRCGLMPRERAKACSESPLRAC